MSDSQSGGTKDAPCIQAQSQRGQSPLPRGCRSSQTLSWTLTPLRKGAPTDWGWVGVHPCVWALAAFGTPGWSLLGQVGYRGSPLPQFCLPPRLGLSQPQ